MASGGVRALLPTSSQRYWWLFTTDADPDPHRRECLPSFLCKTISFSCSYTRGWIHYTAHTSRAPVIFPWCRGDLHTLLCILPSRPIYSPPFTHSVIQNNIQDIIAFILWAVIQIPCNLFRHVNCSRLDCRSVSNGLLGFFDTLSLLCTILRWKTETERKEIRIPGSRRWLGGVSF